MTGKREFFHSSVGLTKKTKFFYASLFFLVQHEKSRKFQSTQPHFLPRLASGCIYIFCDNDRNYSSVITIVEFQLNISDIVSRLMLLLLLLLLLLVFGE